MLMHSHFLSTPEVLAGLTCSCLYHLKKGLLQDKHPEAKPFGILDLVVCTSEVDFAGRSALSRSCIMKKLSSDKVLGVEACCKRF